MRSWLSTSAILLLSACATRASVIPVATTDPVPELRVRHAVRPAVPTTAFLGAVERGTRTMDGRPGAGYWQQDVDYRIDAELAPATALLQAEQVIRYRNNSPDTLHSVLIHLHQNAFAGGAPRVRAVPVTGGMTIRRVTVDGRQTRRAGSGTGTSGPRFRIDGTLMWIDLARPILPGATTQLEIGWHFTVPPTGAPRTGHADREAFVIAQWYPQVAVYDDLRGWHDTPYWTNGEFYLEYADFDVALTVPEGWLVTATGALENAGDVLAANVLARLDRANAEDGIISVVAADDIEQQTVTQQHQGGQLTWRFSARDVRDFAFATSNRYVWDATRATLPDADGDGRSENVRVNALYRPGTPEWENAARYMRHAVAFHAEHWGSYLYPHITAAEGPVGGMEYPMLVFIGGSRTAQSLYSVLSHEIAHQWWPMMVGSNESHNAWQDEGPVTYANDLALRDYFDGITPELTTQDAYLNIAGSDDELPIMTRPDRFGVGPQYGVAAYRKPGTLLRALGGVVGDDVVRTGLREYTVRWLLKHPTAYDFFHVMEDVARRDLDWFWSPWFFDTAVMDQAIETVDATPLGSGERVTIRVADHGSAPMPVLIAVTMADGQVHELRLPVEPWLDGRVEQTVTVDLPTAVARVEIDPARLFPDVDRANNVWQRQ